MSDGERRFAFKPDSTSWTVDHPFAISLETARRR
jgi:hypothetical protein